MMCVSAGSKSRLGKAAGAEVASQSRQEKWHAAVARSAFSSQNVQNTSAAERFWKFRCGKIARRCSEKQISSKNVQNRPLSGHFWKFRCGKPLWREAHCQVKMYKTHHCRSTFGRWDVENLHAAVARSTF